MDKYEMTLAELLEVLEHVENAFHNQYYIEVPHGSLIRNGTVNVVFWDDENGHFNSVLSVETTVQVQFKDYDLQIQQLMKQQENLDKWFMNRIKKNED